MKTIHMMQHTYMHKMYTMMNGIKIDSNIATDSKKDDCIQLANVTMPTNPHETGNL